MSSVKSLLVITVKFLTAMQNTECRVYLALLRDGSGRMVTRCPETIRSIMQRVIVVGMCARPRDDALRGVPGRSVSDESP